MRKISEEICQAFIDGRAKRIGKSETNGACLYLHGNTIARKVKGGIELTLAGWGTATTRERLNTVCDLLGYGRPFSQMDFGQYFNETKISVGAVIRIPSSDGLDAATIVEPQ